MKRRDIGDDLNCSQIVSDGYSKVEKLYLKNDVENFYLLKANLKEQASRRYDNKSHKWVPDSAEGFVPAPITVIEGNELTIRMSNNEKIKVNINNAQSINSAKYDKAEDLAVIPYLNEASVLHTLRRRFSALLTYTYAGPVCIFINPYKRLPIYTDSIATMYTGQRCAEMPPHLFAIADGAYRGLLRGASFCVY
uniref:Myosin motor domain-containing protein n=1 Tax=Syphacia muris TaxID=451379 RepID=A0A0N5A8U8_9BILA